MLTISQTTILRPLITSVHFIMLVMAKQLQVFYSVVVFDTIYVMYMLFWAKFAIEVFLHNISMFEHSFFATNPRHDVAIARSGATTIPVGVVSTNNILRPVSVITLLTAILSLGKSRLKTGVTLFTSLLSKVFIMLCRFIEAELTVIMSMGGRAFIRTKKLCKTFVVFATKITFTPIYFTHTKDYTIC